MKILVLGGSGFIGSYLVEQLVSDGHSVRVFDRCLEKFHTPLAEVDYQIAQFGNALVRAKALEGIDTVYHLISTTVPSTSILNPIADIEDNLIPTIGFFEQMVKAGVKRIIYMSSGGAVYGNPEKVPISESHPLHPICPYGVTKIAVENYLLMYQKLYGLLPIILRPSNAYGPRQGHLGVQGVIATFLYNIIRDKPLEVWGNGSVIRDYLYVEDLVKLCIVAGNSNHTGIFNVGSGRGYSISSVIKIISDIVGKKIKVIYHSGRQFDVRNTELDITKVKKTFNWSAKVSLKDGIKKHWLWVSEMANQGRNEYFE